MSNEINAKFIEDIKQMTVLQLSELVKALEEAFGVTAAVVAGGGGGGPKEEEEDKVVEQTEFTVHIASVGQTKINVIKAVRQITGLGLKEAKALVDGAPCNVRENIPREEAEEAAAALREAGAEVEIK
ncbi:MAG: 50S ribosomal protein L7/L12 [Clostridiaceae bacterium]|nr:50S ribosomal protein L7/L12 [Clostridiaceae bacterium]